MAMLAGPKRKQKWTLNPRGKQWSEDSNKFGQKMLEKMGWTSGKGLGAKEQGMVDHIRVKVKNDQVGIGFDKNRDDHWTEHQDDFNSFLQNLQKEQAGAPVEIPQEQEKALSGKSLEERSKLSQKRVHYKKFTRGKDVNKYSTKDLANIFGKRDLNEKTTVEEKEEDDEKIHDPVGAQDHTAGILTIKGGNMNDYFKKKFNRSEHTDTVNEKENSESESEVRAGFGFSVEKSKSTFYVNNDNTDENIDSDGESNKYSGFGFVKSSDTKTKTKKHNNLNYVFDNPCLDLNILDNDSPVPSKIKTESVDLEYTEKATPRKRKSEYIYDNIGLDLDCPDRSTPKKMKTEPVLNAYENPALDLNCSDNPIPKKKKNSKVIAVENGYENPALDLENLDQPIAEKNFTIESTINGIANPALDLEYPDRPTPKKSKKIKLQPAVNGIGNPGLDLEYPERPTPKKSKKLKAEQVSNGIENPGLDLEFPDRPTPKKTKKLKDVEITSNGIENAIVDVQVLDRPMPKKLNKIKDIQVMSAAFENPALDLDHHSSDACSTSDFEVTRVTCGLENNALDLSDEKSSKKRVTFNDQVEYNTDTIKKKKKKKRKLDKYEVVNEKSKKKSKPEPELVTFVNEGLDSEIMNAEEIDNEINERKSKKGKRRRRQRRMLELETIQEAPEEDNSNEASEPIPRPVENNEIEIEIVTAFTSKRIEGIADVDVSKKKRKKDKKKNQSVTDTIEEITAENDITEISSKVTGKKKKKLLEKSTKVRIEEITISDMMNDPGKENVCKDKSEETSSNNKKEKRKKKSDTEIVSLEEFLNEESIEEKETKHVKSEAELVSSTSDTPVIFADDSNLSSFQKFKMSKQVMKSLFLKNPTLIFNGSNINEIKGYGSSLQNN